MKAKSPSILSKEYFRHFTLFGELLNFVNAFGCWNSWIAFCKGEFDGTIEGYLEYTNHEKGWEYLNLIRKL